MILIDAGILIAAGSPKELKKEYIKNKVIQLDCSDIYKAAEILEKENITDSISIFGNSLHLTMKEQIRSLNELEDDEIRTTTDLLSNDNDLKIYHISEISPSLEDVFLYLVEKKTADEE
ncbi:MAG: DUF4162 domain-containing protein [Ignavibacteria bacterium]